MLAGRPRYIRIGLRPAGAVVAVAVATLAFVLRCIVALAGAVKLTAATAEHLDAKTCHKQRQRRHSGKQGYQ